jgi:hypothetical protein
MFLFVQRPQTKESTKCSIRKGNCVTGALPGTVHPLRAGMTNPGNHRGFCPAPKWIGGVRDSNVLLVLGQL